MAGTTTFDSIAITDLGGDNIVNATEAGTGGFIINGTGAFSNTPPVTGSTIQVILNFSGGVTQTVTATIGTVTTGGGAHNFAWRITDTNLSSVLSAQGPNVVSVTFPGIPGTSSPGFAFTNDTVAPSTPQITLVTDDVLPGTGSLAFGASTNDPDLTVKVSLTGTNAVVGNTVQLNNVGTTTSPLGAIYTLTPADITAGFANVQTGALANTGTFNITAQLTDQAGNVSGASPTFTVTEDPTAVCFVRGTHLLTSTGEMFVEALQLGEPMVVIDGTMASVKWIGRRRINLTTHPRPETVAPIRIQRDAVADNMPHSDLLVSPDHAIFVDGKLICARQLVNGSTIRQENGWASVEYFHVELDSHAILLAEGLPAESYLNTGNQGFFANSDAPLILHPDLTDETDYPAREAGSCAPFVSDEASVRPVWQHLAERAAALGQPAPKLEATGDPDLRIVAKGRTVRPVSGENGRYVFVLPNGATEVRLISRADSPTDVRPWLDDRRSLGVCVERIVLRGANELREVPVDHPGLSQGWWAVEHDGTALRRWTEGDALLPLPALDGPMILEIRASNGGMTYLASANQDGRVA